MSLDEEFVVLFEVDDGDCAGEVSMSDGGCDRSVDVVFDGVDIAEVSVEVGGAAMEELSVEVGSSDGPPHAAKKDTSATEPRPTSSFLIILNNPPATTVESADPRDSFERTFPPSQSARLTSG